ncbi:hypothetical protein [Telluribacter sp.]|jgi:hypothetical protein|nr:hypothetical protein [Telluribacter sp.]
MTKPDPEKQPRTDGLPPFVKTWPQLYTIVIATLVLMIVLFYLFMTHFQ